MPKKTGTIHIKWVRSGIAFPRKQKEVVKSIGLHRLNQVVERPDTVHFRGLVAKVSHLVELVEPSSVPAWVNTPEYTIVPAAPNPKALVRRIEKAVSETPAEPAAPEKKAAAPRKKPAAAKSADTESSAKKASASTEKPKRKSAAPKSAAKEESKSKKGKK